MRYIKFRAWQNNDMLYTPNAKPWFSLHRFFGFLNDSCIVMQYTGLKDKNGKEIYEGDILKVSNYKLGTTWPKPTYTNRVVTWDESVGRWTFDNDKVWGMIYSDIEIIGNIHENPELL